MQQDESTPLTAAALTHLLPFVHPSIKPRRLPSLLSCFSPVHQSATLILSCPPYISPLKSHAAVHHLCIFTQMPSFHMHSFMNFAINPSPPCLQSYCIFIRVSDSPESFILFHPSQCHLVFCLPTNHPLALSTLYSFHHLQRSVHQNFGKAVFSHSVQTLFYFPPFKPI